MRKIIKGIMKLVIVISLPLVALLLWALEGEGTYKEILIDNWKIINEIFS